MGGRGEGGGGGREGGREGENLEFNGHNICTVSFPHATCMRGSTALI